MEETIEKLFGWWGFAFASNTVKWRCSWQMDKPLSQGTASVRKKCESDNTHGKGVHIYIYININVFIV